MRALLDINVLIALFDPDHVSHEPAMQWFAAHAKQGWASCPLTQNGCVRIMSTPSYPNFKPVQALVSRLAEACAQSIHEFWHHEPSILDPGLFDATRIHGPRQITDAYLLGLAVRNQGRFVTFDGRVPLQAVRTACEANLVVLQP
ncbi:MAG TPA: TA system VapC family ribonuclease toxin [Steroidobacteraceae bacterium]|nr:TA system VapC family ribonuclease toxin [Steroidobacteraceae bacterium]